MAAWSRRGTGIRGPLSRWHGAGRLIFRQCMSGSPVRAGRSRGPPVAWSVRDCEPGAHGDPWSSRPAGTGPAGDEVRADCCPHSVAASVVARYGSWTWSIVVAKAHPDAFQRPHICYRFATQLLLKAPSIQCNHGRRPRAVWRHAPQTAKLFTLFVRDHTKMSKEVGVHQRGPIAPNT